MLVVFLGGKGILSGISLKNIFLTLFCPLAITFQYLGHLKCTGEMARASFLGGGLSCLLILLTLENCCPELY